MNDDENDYPHMLRQIAREMRMEGGCTEEEIISGAAAYMEFLTAENKRLASNVDRMNNVGVGPATRAVARSIHKQITVITALAPVSYEMHASLGADLINAFLAEVDGRE